MAPKWILALCIGLLLPTVMCRRAKAKRNAKGYQDRSNWYQMSKQPSWGQERSTIQDGLNAVAKTSGPGGYGSRLSTVADWHPGSQTNEGYSPESQASQSYGLQNDQSTNEFEEGTKQDAGTTQEYSQDDQNGYGSQTPVDFGQGGVTNADSFGQNTDQSDSGYKSNSSPIIDTYDQSRSPNNRGYKQAFVPHVRNFASGDSGRTVSNGRKNGAGIPGEVRNIGLQVPVGLGGNGDSDEAYGKNGRPVSGIYGQRKGSNFGIRGQNDGQDNDQNVDQGNASDGQSNGISRPDTYPGSEGYGQRNADVDGNEQNGNQNTIGQNSENDIAINGYGQAGGVGISNYDSLDGPTIEGQIIPVAGQGINEQTGDYAKTRQDIANWVSNSWQTSIPIEDNLRGKDINPLNGNLIPSIQQIKNNADGWNSDNSNELSNQGSFADSGIPNQPSNNWEAASSQMYGVSDGYALNGAKDSIIQPEIGFSGGYQATGVWEPIIMPGSPSGFRNQFTGPGSPPYDSNAKLAEQTESRAYNSFANGNFGSKTPQGRSYGPQGRNNRNGQGIDAENNGGSQAAPGSSPNGYRGIKTPQRSAGGGGRGAFGSQQNQDSINYPSKERQNERGNRHGSQNGQGVSAGKGAIDRPHQTNNNYKPQGTQNGGSQRYGPQSGQAPLNGGNGNVAGVQPIPFGQAPLNGGNGEMMQSIPFGQDPQNSGQSNGITMPPGPLRQTPQNGGYGLQSGQVPQDGGYGPQIGQVPQNGRHGPQIGQVPQNGGYGPQSEQAPQDSGFRSQNGQVHKNSRFIPQSGQAPQNGQVPQNGGNGQNSEQAPRVNGFGPQSVQAPQNGGIGSSNGQDPPNSGYGGSQGGQGSQNNGQGQQSGQAPQDNRSGPQSGQAPQNDEFGSQNGQTPQNSGYGSQSRPGSQNGGYKQQGRHVSRDNRFGPQNVQTPQNNGFGQNGQAPQNDGFTSQSGQVPQNNGFGLQRGQAPQNNKYGPQGGRGSQNGGFGPQSGQAPISDGYGPQGGQGSRNGGFGPQGGQDSQNGGFGPQSGQAPIGDGHGPQGGQGSQNGGFGPQSGQAPISDGYGPQSGQGPQNDQSRPQNGQAHLNGGNGARMQPTPFGQIPQNGVQGIGLGMQPNPFGPTPQAGEQGNGIGMPADAFGQYPLNDDNDGGSQSGPFGQAPLNGGQGNEVGMLPDPAAAGRPGQIGGRPIPGRPGQVPINPTNGRQPQSFGRPGQTSGTPSYGRPGQAGSTPSYGTPGKAPGSFSSVGPGQSPGSQSVGGPGEVTARPNSGRPGPTPDGPPQGRPGQTPYGAQAPGVKGDSSDSALGNGVRPQGNFKGGDGGDAQDDDPSEWGLEDSIPGTPGEDYPNLDTIPDTGFDCKQQPNPGYYGDVNAQCQVFHICQADGRSNSFLCPVGTIFNQQYFICDWWFNVNCAETPNYYNLNANLYSFSENGNFKGDPYPNSGITQQTIGDSNPENFPQNGGNGGSGPESPIPNRAMGDAGDNGEQGIGATPPMPPSGSRGSYGSTGAPGDSRPSAAGNGAQGTQYRPGVKGGSYNGNNAQNGGYDQNRGMNVQENGWAGQPQQPQQTPQRGKQFRPHDQGNRWNNGATNQPTASNGEAPGQGGTAQPPPNGKPNQVWTPVADQSNTKNPIRPQNGGQYSTANPQGRNAVQDVGLNSMNGNRRGGKGNGGWNNDGPNDNSYHSSRWHSEGSAAVSSAENAYFEQNQSWRLNAPNQQRLNWFE